MKVDSKKVRAKIVNIAKKHCQFIKSIHHFKDVDCRFSIVVKVDVSFVFLDDLRLEFDDKYICVFADNKDVLVLLDINNKNYWM